MATTIYLFSFVTGSCNITSTSSKESSSKYAYEDLEEAPPDLGQHQTQRIQPMTVGVLGYNKSTNGTGPASSKENNTYMFHSFCGRPLISGARGWSAGVDRAVQIANFWSCRRHYFVVPIHAMPALTWVIILFAPCPY